MKSFLLLFASFAASIVVHTGLRMWGYTNYYTERRSPILQKEQNHIYQTSLTKENYFLGLSSIKSACEKDCLLSIPTYFSSDQKLVVFDGEVNERQHLKKENIKSLDELASSLEGKLQSLKGFLALYPEAKGIIHFEANKPGIVKALVPILAENKNYKRFILCSSFGNVVRSIRKEKPHWKTCASQDEETKAHMLSSIYLESIASIPTEYFYFSELDLTRYSARLLDEIKRRTYFSIIPFEQKDKFPAKAFYHSSIDTYLNNK